MNLKKIWSDPVWSKVISAGILALLASLYATVSGSWGSVWHGVGVAWDYITADVLVSRWALSLLWVWALLATTLIIAVAVHNVSQSKSVVNDWRSYRSDNFFGLKWRWKLHEAQPYDICAFCPVCDLQLDPQYENHFRVTAVMQFQCDYGHGSWPFQETWNSLEDRITRMIQQKLRNGTWKAPSADERQIVDRLT